MTLYAESSAVLGWLLEEEAGEPARELLAAAATVIASDLTLVECDRVLRRATAAGKIAEAGAADRRGRLAAAAAAWHVLRIEDDVVQRARGAFPIEPVRTLDALHLASALVARSAQPGLTILSTDERVRANAQALGFDVIP
ncbi:MAG: type II toxin-antitoxin system VapC family toxin [Longimicrobiales bacterium]